LSSLTTDGPEATIGDTFTVPLPCPHQSRPNALDSVLRTVQTI
jgi:hypothetical protein